MKKLLLLPVVAVFGVAAYLILHSKTESKEPSASLGSFAVDLKNGTKPVSKGQAVVPSNANSTQATIGQPASNGGTSSYRGGNDSGAESDALAPLSPEEIQTVRTFGNMFVKIASGKLSAADIVSELKKMGLHPVVAQSFNEDTGKMVIIRTSDALPGSRYFHAQIFEDANKKSFVQHVSAEFKPAKDTMDVSVATLAESQGQYLGKLITDTGKMKVYQGRDNMQCWANKLNMEDIKKPNPFNAHSKEDVGTVWVACERNPEMDDGESAGRISH